MVSLASYTVLFHYAFLHHTSKAKMAKKFCDFLEKVVLEYQILLFNFNALVPCFSSVRHKKELLVARMHFQQVEAGCPCILARLDVRPESVAFPAR